MKRILILLAAVTIVLSAAAQRPMATLSHDGELSFFTSLSAFQEALDSAKNGDTIYLSEGKFASASSEITINKRLSIVGCGYKSVITSDLKMDMSGNTTYMDAPMFDGVRMQKLTFNNDDGSRSNLKNVEIKKSWIRELTNGGFAGNDFMIDRCYIEAADFNGASTNNILVQNTKIGEIKQAGGSVIQVMNCNIAKLYYCPRLVISSILRESTYTYSGRLVADGSCVIYNTLFGSKNMTSGTPAYSDRMATYNCYYNSGGDTGLFDDKLDCTLDLAEKGYLGEDGTVVGVYGGEFPFSETPTVPTVDSAKSSVEYDKESNKLNVTITVAPN